MSSELRKRWIQAGGTIPDDWRVVPLEELLRDNKSIAVGVMYPGPNTLGGTPLIKVGDVNGGQVAQAPSYCISAEVNSEYKRTVLAGDELLITLVGNPGECVVVRPHMAGWNAARAIAVVRLSDPGLRVYLKTVLESAACKHLIDAVLNTTVQKTLNLKDIRLLPIPMPPMSDIRGISALSEALNDRITLLRETNATLEAIAQALFKSWFVDFDPVRAKAEGRARQDGERSGQPRMPQASDLPRPGAEAGAEAQGQPEGAIQGSMSAAEGRMPKAAMDATTAALFPDSFEESELGLVPKGWRVGKIEDLVELAYGKALKATDRNDGPVPVYGSGGITGYHDLALVAGPSIIVGRKGTVGSLYWEDQPFFPIDTVFYVKTDQPLTYCYYLLQTLGLEDMNTDGAVPGLNRGNVYRLPVVIPDASVLNVFNEITAKLRVKIFANQQQAQTLTQLRDTLLPRLISGQLRLPEAETLLEKAL